VSCSPTPGPTNHRSISANHGRLRRTRRRGGLSRARAVCRMTCARAGSRGLELVSDPARGSVPTLLGIACCLVRLFTELPCPLRVGLGQSAKHLRSLLPERRNGHQIGLGMAVGHELSLPIGLSLLRAEGLSPLIAISARLGVFVSRLPSNGCRVLIVHLIRRGRERCCSLWRYCPLPCEG
jgi:hypothetical protein